MAKAWLEKIGGEWFDDFVYISKFPLMDMGYEIKSFDSDDLTTLKPQEGDVIFGSVQGCTDFFNKLSISVPEYIGYPEELKPYLGRNISTGVLTPDIKLPQFVKPKSGVKLFTGSLVENKTRLSFLNEYMGTEIYISEPINFISEWRCFINRGKLIGIQYYIGDFTKYPNIDRINEMISKWTGPISWSLDVGVTENGTFLVEVNDAWALGSYGLGSRLYTRFVVDRFKELFNVKTDN